MIVRSNPCPPSHLAGSCVLSWFAVGPVCQRVHGGVHGLSLVAAISGERIFSFRPIFPLLCSSLHQHTDRQDAPHAGLCGHGRGVRLCSLPFQLSGWLPSPSFSPTQKKNRRSNNVSLFPSQVGFTSVSTLVRLLSVSSLLGTVLLLLFLRSSPVGAGGGTLVSGQGDLRKAAPQHRMHLPLTTAPASISSKDP